MTPADIAEKLFKYQTAARARGAYTDCACPGEDEVADAIAEACGAALRERDARWLAAFDTYITAGTELYCRHCNSILRDPADPASCNFCRPLRALLEEAGK